METKLKPFLPDFIPAVGDPDAFMKIDRPDEKVEFLGLTVIDEPSVRLISIFFSHEAYAIEIFFRLYFQLFITSTLYIFSQIS